MGLLSFLRGSNGKAHKGKHARQESPDPVQAEIERTKEAIEERKRNSPRFCVEDSDNRTFEPPAPCGFSFDNVNYHHRVQGDKETGEILKDDVWVDLREPNYSANLRNIIETLEVIDLAENEVSGFPSAAYRQLIEGAYANGYFKRKGRSMHYCSGFIKVLPLTASGKVKKHPIECNMEYSVPTNVNASLEADRHDSVLLTAKYGKDGNIGAGEYILWEGRDGWIISFDRRKDGSYSLKSIKHSRINETSGSSGWNALYKRGKV